MSNDKVDATFHPGERRVYRVEHMVTAWGAERYVCPICGELSGAVLRGHGPEHIIEDASQ